MSEPKRFRLKFTVDVDAVDEKTAGDIATAIYERVGKDIAAIEGVRFFLPVADVLPDPFAGMPRG